MSSAPRLHGHRGVIAAVAVVLGLGGASAIAVALPEGGPAQPPRTSVAPEPVDASDDPTEPAAAVPIEPPPATSPHFGPVLEASTPVGVSIPAIELTTGTLVPLGIDDAGALRAPIDYATAGFHVGGPTPGQLGPAVIAGHVDGPGGPAIFFRLGELTAGAEVRVARDDGTDATFVVDSVERFAKAEFPTSRVYGNTTDRAELRLITCGGAFDPVTGHYVDNIVVFAHLVA